MSVFRIFKGGKDYAAEYRGTALAGKVFEQLWTELKDKNDPSKGYKHKPGQIYEELIYKLIEQGCIVEYNKKNQNYIVKRTTAGGKKIIYYEKGVDKFPIDLKVVRDSNDDDVIYMAVPHRRDVKANDGYLANAVNAIKAGGNLVTNQQFLFGLVLLKRCR